MTFRHISELAGDVMRRLELTIEEPGTERSTVKCAHPSGPSQRCPAANEGGDQPNRGGVTIEPVAFVGEGDATNYGMGKNGRAVKPGRVGDQVVKEPTRITPRVMPTIASMSMVTVTAATKGRRPSAPAVIIDMMAWKVAHAATDFRRGTL